MKKYLLLLVTCLPTLTLWAGTLTPQQAAQVAAQFFSVKQSHKASGATAPVLNLVYTKTQPQSVQPAFYVFNRGENEGFVLIAADDAVESILGYADEGQFVTENMPAHIQWWMDRYARYVEQQMAFTPAIKVVTEANNYTPVSPLLTTKWNQDDPYNALCPSDENGKCITGCVATCHAQIIKYYGEENNPTGSYSYTWNGQTLSVDFGGYDWKNMLDEYTGSETQAQMEAVAKLMYHCGVACEMNYTSSSSAASPNDMIQAMIDHFGFDKGIEMLYVNYMSMDTVLTKMNRDLLAGHPISISAYTDQSGHSFACDGMDAQGRVHINWGWGGKSDGYYRFCNMNPSNQGLGGSVSGDAYTENILAFIGIQPDKHNTYQLCITSDTIFFPDTTYKKSGYVYFPAKNLSNKSLTTWNGSLVLAVYDASSYDYVTNLTWAWDAVTLKVGYRYTELQIPYKLSSLPDGKYLVKPYIYDQNLRDTFELHLLEPYSNMGYITVKGDQISISSSGYMYDSQDQDFNETFDEYQVSQPMDGFIIVKATNNITKAHVALAFNVGSAITLTSDDYYVSVDGGVGTVQAAPAIYDGSVTPSYAGYTNDDNTISVPLWFLEKGIVNVLPNGAIRVKGLNSYGRTIYIEIGDLDPMTQIESDADKALNVTFDATPPEILLDNAYVNVKNISAQKYAELCFKIPFGSDSLPAGVYPINGTKNIGTLFRGTKDENYIYPSYISTYINQAIKFPIWFLGKGQATVYENGAIKIEGTNTKGYEINVTIGTPPLLDVSFPTAQSPTPTTYKTLSNGTIVIIREGKQYSILGY